MGALSTLAVSLAGLAVGAAAVTGVGEVAGLRATADAAADLAALAGAGARARGEPLAAACSRAGHVASGTGAVTASGAPHAVVSVSECVALGVDLGVTVQVRARILGLHVAVTSTASAGPVRRPADES